MLKRIFILLAIVVSAFATLGLTLQLGASTDVRFALAPAVAPTIDVATPPPTIDEDVTYTLLLTVTDDLSSTLALSVDSGALSTMLTPANGMVNASGVLTAALLVTPVEANGLGTYPITITVSDDEASPNVVSETLMITINEVNITPTVGVITDQSVSEGSLLSIPIVALDEDWPASVLTVTVLPALPAGAMLITSTNTITWTPSESQGAPVPLSYPLTVVVSDGQLSASEAFTIYVGEVNETPTISTLSNMLITESVPLAFTMVATDTDIPAQPLTFTMSSQPTSTATIDPNSGLFNWTPTEAEGGTAYTVEIFVTDGALTSSTNAVITVVETNEAPTLMLVDQSISETVQLSVTLNGADADFPDNTLLYTIVASTTASAELDANTGLFQWTPTEAEGGQQFSVTVSVSDTIASATDTFTITVVEVNSAPMFDPIVAQQVSETQQLTFTLTVTDTDDPPNTPLTMTLASITPTAVSTPSFDGSTGVFDWTPDELDGSQQFTATFEVTDGHLTGTIDVAIDVLESYVTPTLAVIPPQSVTETMLLSFALGVTDPDLPNDVLSYMVASNVATSAEISATTGVFSWTPSDAFGGSIVTFTVTVMDSAGLTATQSFTVTVIDVSLPPVLAPATVQITETVQLNFVVPGSDADVPADVLTYTLVASTTASAEFDPATHTFTWTPTEVDGGLSYTATFSLSDGTYTVTETYAIQVIETNLAPAFLPVASQQISEMVQLTFTLGVTDADIPMNTLSISMGNNAPAGATVNASTGLFSWTPSEADGPGSIVVTFIVSDGSLTSTVDVPITILETNQPPVIPPVLYFEIPETVPFTTVLSASDGDIPTDTLTYRVVSYLPPNATFISDTLSWTPSETFGGRTLAMIVEVTDGTSIVMTTLHFTVTEVNTAPVITSVPLQRVAPQSSLQLTVQATDSDLSPDTLVYSLVNPPAGAVIDPSTGLFSWPNVMTGTTVITVQVTDNGIPPLASTSQFTIETGLIYVYLPIVVRDSYLLTNRGFENGTLSGWTSGGVIGSGVSTAQDLDGSLGISAIPAIAGTYSAHLGNPAYGVNGAPSGFGELRQTISLPSDATKVKLQYRVLTHDQIFANTSQRYFDTFEVYINDTTISDTVRNDRCINNRAVPGAVANGLVLCDGNPAAPTRDGIPANMGLQSIEIDISSVAGTNIDLILRVYNRVDSSYNTWVYLDNIEIVNN
ncbi:MAG: Ig-like domain-containing protein [Candidatus Promineifilaceae bacterium]